MYSYEHARPSVTVDLVTFAVLGGQLQVYLVKRSAAPFAGRWTIPGGFVHDRESLDATAARVLREKTDVKHAYFEQLYTFGAPRRDPRDHVISVAYYALLAARSDGSEQDFVAGAWRDCTQLPKLGFDHNQIVNTAVERLRAKLLYTTIGLEFMPSTFTLGELQNVWEVVLGQTLDKRNFRKTVASKLPLTKTGEKTKGRAHPPAALYRRVKT